MEEHGRAWDDLAEAGLLTGKQLEITAEVFGPWANDPSDALT